jgi:signal transduction histidine kinase
VARILRSPVTQFLVIGFLLFLGIAVVTSQFARSAANREALADARYNTSVLAISVAEPSIPRGLVSGRAGAIDRFDREVVDRLLVGDVRRIKIWDARGTIVYSDRAELIGSSYELDEDEVKILEQGGIEAEVSDLSKPENRFERDTGGLVEVYTQIHAPEGDALLFEAYYSARDIEERRESVFLPFRRITIGALLALLAVATPIIWVLTRRLTGAAAERERLLISAIDASSAERRRIARDLHDGVVQDLAGSTFSVAAMARDPQTPGALRTSLADSAMSLRRSLRALRSLLVEIHPPDLRADGLVAALEDLIAPATSTGIETSVAVDGVAGVPDPTVALIWRVAQEAVRNATRHAGATRLSVTVTGGPDEVTLDVVDDGHGFDTAALRDPSHYGLRGLASLVDDAGGRLEVRSARGAGTIVHMEAGRP